MILFKKKKFLLPIALFFLGILIYFVPGNLSGAPSNEVHVIQLNDDTINPVTAEYIINAISDAESRDAQCLIIKLDTPGGLLSSTRLIVKRILSAAVPVVVYIAPGGSRAGSAGVFITYASHIAAMASSTNIGAAHPVQMGGKKGKQTDLWDGLGKLLEQASKKKKEVNETGKTAKRKDRKKKRQRVKEKSEEIEADADPMSSKILQDTVAFIKSIAKKRGRNVEWAIKSVTKSSSITETEALELGVIEIIAQNDSHLLEELDGRAVDINGKKIVLKTKDAYVRHIAMEPRQKFLNILANPNIAYIFMILGFYGLMYEITHPGIGVPGILGAIFLILAFYSMQTLPTNYAGVALILLGLVLFVAEAYVPGLGLLTLGGSVCMILGSLLLFDSSVPVMRVSWPLILSFTGSTAGITIFLVRAVVSAHRRKALGGQEGLLGTKGEVQKTISAGQEGKVFVHGELWNAVADQTIKKGARIEVTAVDGMTLTVKINS